MNLIPPFPADQFVGTWKEQLGARNTMLCTMARIPIGLLMFVITYTDVCRNLRKRDFPDYIRKQWGKHSADSYANFDWLA